MTATHTEQLDKILAMADSGHDSEAVSAVRKARALMIRDGISFGDLAQAAARSPRRLRFSFGSPRVAVDVSTIAHLQARVAELEAQLCAQDLQVHAWRRLAGDLQRRVREAGRLEAGDGRLAPLPARFALPVADR